MGTHAKPKVPIGVLAISVAAAASVGGACAREAQPSGFSLTEGAAWVTVTDIDGVRLDMPKEPEHETVPIAGTHATADLYHADFRDISVAAAATEVPGDGRSDAQVLRDAARGAAAEIGGRIVSSRRTVVDGALALDFEMTTPRQGGQGVFARAALADELLVIVETVFGQDDRDVATEPHERMARSIQFE
jgi:hypothetical protein